MSPGTRQGPPGPGLQRPDRRQRVRTDQAIHHHRGDGRAVAGQDLPV